MWAKQLALMIPAIRRLHEDRERLRARLQEAQELSRKRTASNDAKVLELTQQTAQLLQLNKSLSDQLLKQDPATKLVGLMSRCGVDVVLDVGANTGQFAHKLRRAGYDGEIFSFEPLSAAFAKLQHECSTDDAWTCHNLAVGDTEGDASINVSANSQSSSILQACPWIIECEPSIERVGQENVVVRRLDNILTGLTDSRAIFLKIDTQGFESRVIEGARLVFDRFVLVQMELALTQCYEGQEAFGVMLERMRDFGFEVMQLIPAWTDRAGIVREIDLVFVRKDFCAPGRTSPVTRYSRPRSC